MLSEGGNNVPETQNFIFTCRNQLKETFGQLSQCHLATIFFVSGELGIVDSWTKKAIEINKILRLSGCAYKNISRVCIDFGSSYQCWPSCADVWLISSPLSGLPKHSRRLSLCAVWASRVVQTCCALGFYGWHARSWTIPHGSNFMIWGVIKSNAKKISLAISRNHIQAPQLHPWTSLSHHGMWSFLCQAQQQRTWKELDGGQATWQGQFVELPSAKHFLSCVIWVIWMLDDVGSVKIDGAPADSWGIHKIRSKWEIKYEWLSLYGPWWEMTYAWQGEHQRNASLSIRILLAFFVFVKSTTFPNIYI